MQYRLFIYHLLSLLAGYIIFNACQSREQLDQAQYHVNGKSLYEAHCQNCHGSQGEGLGLLYPPLTDTTSMRANAGKFACYIKEGLTGEITVAGKKFDTEMPANPRLSAIEVAYLITYIGNSFGNQLGIKRDSAVQKDLNACFGAE